jgi:hypothetical protein
MCKNLLRVRSVILDRTRRSTTVPGLVVPRREQMFPSSFCRNLLIERQVGGTTESPATTEGLKTGQLRIQAGCLNCILQSLLKLIKWSRTPNDANAFKRLFIARLQRDQKCWC